MRALPLFSFNDMYRLQEIQERLSKVVGWEQSYDINNPIDEKLTESEGGLYYQQCHPLMTLNNIRSMMPDDFIKMYELYDPEKYYAEGNKVQSGGEVYKCLETVIGENPADSLKWKKCNILDDYLRKLVSDGIAQAVLTFVQMKSLQTETKTLMERRTFFDGAGRINAAIQNFGKIVGFEIVPVRSMGVTAKIERVGLQMRGTGTVKVYLFHSSQIDPIKTFDLNYTKNGGFQWFDLKDCYLPYISTDNNSGGAWYLCYNQNDLPQGMEAINVSKDWSREPCGSCNIGSLEGWRELTSYLQISPFKVDALDTFADYPELWDIEDMNYTCTYNYGLNVEVTTGCDLTDFIISQRLLFQSVLQKQVTYNALRTLAMNPDVRVNRNQSNASRMDILYELDGNSQGRASGLGYELRKAYEAISLDTAGLDRICLSCNNHGVRYRTV